MFFKNVISGTILKFVDATDSTWVSFGILISCFFCYCIFVYFSLTFIFYFVFFVGKDRTGLIAMLTLHLIGATDEEIIADYVLSDNAYKDINNSKAMVVAMKQVIFYPQPKFRLSISTFQIVSRISKELIHSFLSPISISSFFSLLSFFFLFFLRWMLTQKFF